MTLVWLLVLVGGLLWLVSRRWLQDLGLPEGVLIAEDTTGVSRPGQTLVDTRHGLTGKPDYLIRTAGGLIPVEVKPTRKAQRPYESDVFQLVAYCLLVEATSGSTPPYGVLVYANQQWRIPFTAARRAELLQILDAMRADEVASDVARSHKNPARCRGCGVRSSCDMALDHRAG